MILKIKKLRIQPMYRWYDFYVGLYVDVKHKYWRFYFVFFGFLLKVWYEEPVVTIDKIMITEISFTERGTKLGGYIGKKKESPYQPWLRKDGEK